MWILAKEGGTSGTHCVQKLRRSRSSQDRSSEGLAQTQDYHGGEKFSGIGRIL